MKINRRYKIARKIVRSMADEVFAYRPKIYYEIEEPFGWVFYLTHSISYKYSKNFPPTGQIVFIVDFVKMNCIMIPYDELNNTYDYIKKYYEKYTYPVKEMKDRTIYRTGHDIMIKKFEHRMSSNQDLPFFTALLYWFDIQAENIRSLMKRGHFPDSW